MPTIYDNITKVLTDGLKETLKLSSRADFCVGYFNLRGWKEIHTEIECLPGDWIVESKDQVQRYCRLLVGMQKNPVESVREQYRDIKSDTIDQSEVVKIKKKLARDFREQLTIGIPSSADEAALRHLSKQMSEGKTVVKLHSRHPLHAKLYLAYSEDARVPVVGFVGSSNLTLAGLSKQGELNVDVLEQDAANKLARWFDDRWNDRWCLDITQELIEIIDTSWAAEKPVSPYHIYLKMAYHLSQEARAGISEFKLPKIFQDELLDFQKKAVLVAVHHLNKRDGVMIGDVVGLGKTIIATAIAKLCEEDFYFETLIICPKNLKDMWEGYAHKYQLRAKVISQSMVQSTLPNLRRYRLVVIDESHNLRNDQGSRYRAIKNYLEENESKVVLLSATPYNKSYTDLSNQLRLFLSDDKDLGISPEHYINTIGGQVQFLARHTETFIRSVKAFEKSNHADDWRELMRLYLVRRTRSFVRTHYSSLDSETGRRFLTFKNGKRSYFPDRIPRKVVFAFDEKDTNDQYARLYSDGVVNRINHLDLPRYGLANYLDPKPVDKTSAEEERIIANLSRAGKRLMGFCRTNLFKRLESSGFAFQLSLARHVLRNFVFIHAIENNLPLPIGKNIIDNLDDFLEDQDTDDDDPGFQVLMDESAYLKKGKEVYELFAGAHKNRFEWIRSALFAKDLMKELISDGWEIIKILKMAGPWDPAKDQKLLSLHRLLEEKHRDEKVLVFTQYADTAEYLTIHMKAMGVTKIECVTGDNDNPTALAHRFSPESNEKHEITRTGQDLRVLITTDVLSEGQNLQDGHIVVNFDLPWAIIRLIQRAGRVDRIGQKSQEILCYSFLPADGIERIIRLRGRLQRRITENAEVVGSDEVFFDGDPVSIHDLYSEKSGILDEDDDNEVDLASYAYQIWKNATDANPALTKLIPDMPNVVYSTKATTAFPGKDGVIVYTRTVEDNDVLTWMDAKGQLITQSQLAILKVAECHTHTPPVERLENHHDIVKSSMALIREEEKNQGGTLGKKTGVKYRVYMRLDRFCKEYDGTLFMTEPLKRAVDDIYKYPLKEFARDTLSRQLKAGVSDEQLAELVTSLREEAKLCITSDDEPEIRDPQIICSLGLKTEHAE
ncbi:MAG: phospholipase D-like domain-containing protein [Syntrophales bacterium]|nr:phospholipase D-like domain-containing protein [Syntrophales bacterium]